MTANNDPKKGDVWNSYPTFISLNQPSSMYTGKEGYLIYSKAKWEEESHYLAYRKLTLGH